MLKEQLLEEAKTIDTSVELDSIFESVDLSEPVKEKFGLVFEEAVKKQAIALAESHITALAEKADLRVIEESEKLAEANEAKFIKNADKFFEHVAQTWLKENTVAIDKGIKSDLFESMFVGLKGLFVEHNVVLPEESVDVVAELEEELTEAKEHASTIFDEKVALTEELNQIKRDVAIKESTQDLTESQKEKVSSLIEGLAYGDNFVPKLHAIVEMAKVSKASSTEKTLTESATDLPADATGLNYIVEAVDEKPKASAKPGMSQYVKSATRI